jgi:mono/diheme cytochrome c family protein
MELKMKYLFVIGVSLFACGEEPPAKKEGKTVVKKEVKKVEQKEVVKTAEPKKEEVKEVAVAARTGDEVYIQVCQVCHQAGGVGIPGAFPPLAGSEWMAKPNDTLIKIVLHGLQGEIEVKGEKYTSMMTPQAGFLNDQEVANVLTYVRTSFGNTGDAVKTEEVKAVRDANAGHGAWEASEL